MRAHNYLPLLLAPSAALASQAGPAAVSEPLTTDSLVTSVVPGGPIQTFPTTNTESLSPEPTTTTALHPSEPTGISGGAGTATGSSASATATATSSSSSSSSEGAASAFGRAGSSKVALVVALGAGLLGWVAF